MQHDNLVEQASTIITDEEILGAGVFEPSKAVATGAATLHGSSVLGFSKKLEFDGVPQYCMIAVTPTKLYLMSVKVLGGGGNMTFPVVEEPELFSVIERDHLEVSFHLHKLVPSTLLLHDLDNDRHYHLIGSAQKHLYGSAAKVFEALQSQAAGT